MKNLLLILLATLAITACSSNWEYKTVSVSGESTSKFNPNTFSVTDEDLNLFGADGWELVDVYTIEETVHPNFGNKEYVTGLRENTRTACINYVFKRRK